jgi:hypothetical protein
MELQFRTLCSATDRSHPTMAMLAEAWDSGCGCWGLLRNPALPGSTVEAVEHARFLSQPRMLLPGAGVLDFSPKCSPDTTGPLRTLRFVIWSVKLEPSCPSCGTRRHWRWRGEIRSLLQVPSHSGSNQLRGSEKAKLFPSSSTQTEKGALAPTLAPDLLFPLSFLLCQPSFRSLSSLHSHLLRRAFR